MRSRSASGCRRSRYPSASPWACSSSPTRGSRSRASGGCPTPPSPRLRRRLEHGAEADRAQAAALRLVEDRRQRLDCLAPVVAATRAVAVVQEQDGSRPEATAATLDDLRDPGL